MRFFHSCLAPGRASTVRLKLAPPATIPMDRQLLLCSWQCLSSNTQTRANELAVFDSEPGSSSVARSNLTMTSDWSWMNDNKKFTLPNCHSFMFLTGFTVLRESWNQSYMKSTPDQCQHIVDIARTPGKHDHLTSLEEWWKYNIYSWWSDDYPQPVWCDAPNDW